MDKDLFEYYEEQSENLRAITEKWFDKYCEDGFNYNDRADFRDEVNTIGYIFEYGLDAEPYNLRAIN